MWQIENDDENTSNGSETPPLPTRAPAPPPPAFARSHSLGKNEAKLSYKHDHPDELEPPVPLNLLGRHTHHYPAAAAVVAAAAAAVAAAAAAVAVVACLLCRMKCFPNPILNTRISVRP